MDIFNHIGDNRNEKIAIPFYGWIKNPVEAMIGTLRDTENIDQWERKYPFMHQMLTAPDSIRLFNITSLYSIKSFLNEMCKCQDRIDPKEIESDFSHLTGIMDPNKAIPTVMELMVARLASEDFVKGIYLYAPWFSDVTKAYISNIYRENTNKIFLIEGSLKNIIETRKEMSTIFVENVDDLMDIIQLQDDGAKILKNKFFVISAMNATNKETRTCIIENRDYSKLKENFKYEEYLKTLPNRFGSYAEFLQLKPFVFNKPKMEE